MLRTTSTASILRAAIASAALVLRGTPPSILRGAILRTSASPAIRRCIARMFRLPVLRVVRRAPSASAFIRPLLAFMMVMMMAAGLAAIAGAPALERGPPALAGVPRARSTLAVLWAARRVVVVVALAIAAVVGFRKGVSVSIVSADETMAIGRSLGPGREIASACMEPYLHWFMMKSCDEGSTSGGLGENGLEGGLPW